MKEREDPFSTYQENKILLNSIFMKDKMEKYSKQLDDNYFSALIKAREKIEMTRDPLELGMIQDIVSDYLKDMQWHVKYDAAHSDFDPQYRFDLVARKEKRTIVVLVQPELTRKSIQDIQREIFDVKKEMPSTRVLLATDILELPYILQRGALSDFISDMAKKYRLGILFLIKIWTIRRHGLCHQSFCIPRQVQNTRCKLHLKRTAGLLLNGIWIGV